MKYIIYLFVFIMLVVNIFLIKNASGLKKRNDILQTYLKRCKVQSDQDYSILTSKLIASIKYSKKNVLSPNHELRDSSNKFLRIKDILNSKSPKIIFRFAESNCSSCVDQQMIKLGKLAEIIGNENVIALTTYTALNSLKVLIKHYNLKFPIYNISTESLGNNEIEKLNTPYLFLINNSLDTEMLFIPETHLSQLSDEYYKSLEDYFLSKDYKKGKI